jgi:hypothetical protein
MLTISQLPQVVHPQTIQAVQQVSSRLIEFAKTYFLFVSNICLVGLGFRDYTVVALGRQPNFPSVKEFFHNLWIGITSGNLEFIQGSCFVCSGISGALSFYYPAMYLDVVGNGLFLVGNLIALMKNIEAYIQAVKLSGSADEVICQQAKRNMLSAVFGILNNINYIMIPFVTVFGGPVALAIVFGGIAITTGCIKILYDYFYLRAS